MSDPNYGLTPKGPNIKRLDVIMEEMHEDLSKKWGVNTRQNPKSLINVLITNIADRLAELWEFGESVYYSQYPSTAEGTSLDNAAQYGGSTRSLGSKSYYPMHCKGTDGTKLAAGTTIASNTNPKTFLTLNEEKEITRNSFNRAEIKVVSAVVDSVYTVIIDGNAYSYTASSINLATILNGLASAITDQNFITSVDETNNILTVASETNDTSHTLVLSENLTTETVTSVISFGTVETGDILLPDGAITEIVKADAGLLSVTNPCGYVAGSSEETDTEFRQSYIDKIFNRSSMMLESIRSAILTNVPGVTSVATYQNDTDYVTMTYASRGTESEGAACFFPYDNLWYKFNMPNMSGHRKLVFNGQTKRMTKSDTLVFKAKGTEDIGKISYLHYGSKFYSFAMPGLAENDTLVFDAFAGTMEKPVSYVYNASNAETEGKLYAFLFGGHSGSYISFRMPDLADGEKLEYTLSGRTLRKNPVLVYEATGEENINQATVFAYDGKIYSFTMPETSQGDEIRFRTFDKTLKFNGAPVQLTEVKEILSTDTDITDDFDAEFTVQTMSTANIPDGATDLTAAFAYSNSGVEVTASEDEPSNQQEITAYFQNENSVPLTITQDKPVSGTDITEYMDRGISPHCVEIVVDGGDSSQIASQILANKAGGIGTYGTVAVNLPGVYDEDITIRFTRPETVYVWVRLGVSFKSNENVPSNYVELLKNEVLKNIGNLDAGQDVVPQEFMSDLYRSCTGISYIDISIAKTASEAERPSTYPNRSVAITARQRAYTTAAMIEVVING